MRKTLCSLLSMTLLVGCIKTELQKPKQTIIDIPAVETPTEPIEEPKQIIYHSVIVLPNREIIQAKDVLVKGKEVYFCSYDRNVIDKSYLEGKVVGIDAPGQPKRLIQIRTEYSPHLFAVSGEFPEELYDYYQGFIAVPTIEQTDKYNCEKSKGYHILHEKDAIDAKLIKFLKKDSP